MSRAAIPATFPRLGEPIGMATIRGERVEVYPSETFLRLLEALYLRLGGPADQVAEVTQVAAQTSTLAGETAAGLEAAQDEVASVSAAAAAAGRAADEAARTAAGKLDPAALSPLLARLSALENVVFP